MMIRMGTLLMGWGGGIQNKEKKMEGVQEDNNEGNKYIAEKEKGTNEDVTVIS